MQQAALEKVPAATPGRASGELPLGFGGQSLPGPAREGVRLVEAHVGHRGLLDDRPQPGQGVLAPLFRILLPIERRMSEARLLEP